MQVVKRDGSKETVKLEKVTKRIERQCKDLKHVDPILIAQKVINGIYDGVSSKELDTLAMETAAALSVEHPEYDKLAARLAVSALHKETESSFSATIEKLYNAKDISGKKRPIIADDVYKIVKKNAHILDNAIDYKRDYLFDYFGFKTLEKSYLLRINEFIDNKNYKKIVERPQHLWMRVAVGIHKNDIDAALKTYEMLSTFQATHATPTLFNSGCVKNQLSSCFLMGMDDSIAGIYDCLKDTALISQNSGGCGIHITNLRSNLSPIYGTGGTSNGIIPLLRVFHETARYVDQCFTPDNKIKLNNSDVKNIDLLDNNDKIKSINTDDSKFIKKKFQYSGKIIEINSKIKCTPQHLILAVKNASGLSDDIIKTKINTGFLKLEWLAAEELTSNDLIVCYG